MSQKTVAFFGASTGVGLSALTSTLAAGHRCIALCRVPEKLTAVFPPESTPNLHIVSGNIHDVEAISKCLVREDGNLVDNIIFTVGAKPDLVKFTIDDPEVCRKGMANLLEALAQLRRSGATGQPHIVACSTTGMSKCGRDYPLLLLPVYRWMLKAPHEDKKIMEDSLAASGEDYTVTRASLLVNGETDNKIRVGIEDVKTGLESKAIGYTISREDAGKWVAKNIVLERNPSYVNKLVTITY